MSSRFPKIAPALRHPCPTPQTLCRERVAERYVYISVLYILTYRYIHTHPHKYIYIYIYTHMCTCKHVYMRIYIYIYMCVCAPKLRYLPRRMSPLGLFWRLKGIQHRTGRRATQLRSVGYLDFRSGNGWPLYGPAVAVLVSVKFPGA